MSIKLQEMEIQKLRKDYESLIGVKRTFNRLIIYNDKKFRGYRLLGHCDYRKSSDVYFIEIALEVRKHPLIYKYILIHELTHSIMIEHTHDYYFNGHLRVYYEKAGIDIGLAETMFDALVKKRYYKYIYKRWNKIRKNRLYTLENDLFDCSVYTDKEIRHAKMIEKKIDNKLMNFIINKNYYKKLLNKLTKEVKE